MTTGRNETIMTRSETVNKHMATATEEAITKATMANVLGYGGLIPFIALSLASWLQAPLSAWAITLLITYAAIILGFMGAIHWGAALVSDNSNANVYIASIVSPLLAWAALFMPLLAGFAALIAGFILLYIYDARVSVRLAFTSWYIPLRKRLTIIVSLCLLVALASIIVNQGIFN